MSLETKEGVKIMAEFTRFLTWAILVAVTCAVAWFLANRIYRRYLPADEAWDTVFWFRLTNSQWFLIGFTRAICSVAIFLTFFSPLYVEYPNFVGKPVVATIEDGKLVYHPWGISEFPWWLGKNQKVVNVVRWGTCFRETAPVKDNAGKVGILFWYVCLSAVDLETFYLKADKDSTVYRRALLRHFMEGGANITALDFADVGSRMKFCDYFTDKVSADFGSNGVGVTNCYVDFNDSPRAF